MSATGVPVKYSYLLSLLQLKLPSDLLKYSNVILLSPSKLFSDEIGKEYPLHEFPWATVTKYHNWVATNNSDLLSLSLGGEESKVRMFSRAMHPLKSVRGIFAFSYLSVVAVSC